MVRLQIAGPKYIIKYYKIQYFLFLIFPLYFFSGGLFGLIGGCVSSAALALTGLTPDEVLAYDYQKIADRRRKQVEDMKSTRPESPIHTLTLAEFHSGLREENNNKDKDKEEDSESNPSPDTAKTPTTTTPPSPVAAVVASNIDIKKEIKT